MSWDDGKHKKVKKITVTFDDVIHSIQVEYDGTTLKSQPRGTVVPKSDGFTLSPDEYITDVNGYSRTLFAGDVITALTFKTNKKTYGPYGKQSRNSFSINAPSGNQIAGFLGTSGNALNSIDVHFALVPPASSTGQGSNLGPQSLGPEGGKGGKKWDDTANHDGVTKIYIVHGALGIEQIKFDYLKNGETKEGPSHGVKKGGSLSTIEINHPSEYLVSVEGWYGSTDIIQGLRFVKNTKATYSIGYVIDEAGKPFSFEVEGKKITGFHGSADSHLISIGVHVAPVTSTPVKPGVKKLNAEGGDEGVVWDDGDFDDIRKVHVGQKDPGVGFVEVVYNKGSQEIKGVRHGVRYMSHETFELDYPSEYITALKGRYEKSYLGDGKYTTLVVNLTFVTNKRTSQPYGVDSGKEFEIKEEGHKIVGFHGKASEWVHQIGVYVKPITN